MEALLAEALPSAGAGELEQLTRRVLEAIRRCGMGGWSGVGFWSGSRGRVGVPVYLYDFEGVGKGVLWKHTLALLRHTVCGILLRGLPGFRVLIRFGRVPRGF